MATWVPIKEYRDLRFERVEDGIAKITINRPEVRNAFRPQTIVELIEAFDLCRADTSIGVVILTGQGPGAFCSGADLNIGHSGYIGEGAPPANILDVQKQIRALPKPVIAMVAGYAIGGGHVLHVVCDITIAADNARFGQTGPKVGSFDAVIAFLVQMNKEREFGGSNMSIGADDTLEAVRAVYSGAEGQLWELLMSRFTSEASRPPWIWPSAPKSGPGSRVWTCVAATAPVCAFSFAFAVSPR